MARKKKTKLILRRKRIVANTTATAAPTLSHVTLNLQGAKTRYDTYLGKQYLVVPMVMLTEGVHNGSQGPILYKNGDISKAPQAWNKKPIVVYHPEINGVGVSACDPDILNNREIGLIFNSHVKDAKLHSEAWLDEEATDRVDDRILKAINNKEMVELSTGLFMDFEAEEGTWNEEAYVGIARNFQPDHLAILPDQTGACSIKDGAGLLRNQSSHETIRGLIWSALASKFPNDDSTWVEAVFDNFFIFSRDGKLFKLNYMHNDVEVTLEGDPVEVVRITEFRTLSGDFVANYQGDSEMNKEVFVLALIANALTAFTPDDKPYLMGLNEERLRKFGPALNDDGTEKEVKKEDETPPKATVPPTTPPTAPKTPPTGNVTPKTQTVEQFIANAPPGIREGLAMAQRTHEHRKAQVVAVITANANNKFTPEQLAKTDLTTLEAMAALAGAVPVANVADYSGLGDLLGTPTANANETAEEAMELPVMNFGPAA